MIFVQITRHRRSLIGKISNQKRGIFIIRYLKYFYSRFERILQSDQLRSIAGDTMVELHEECHGQREKNERKILVVIGSVTKVASHKSRPRVEKRLVTDVTWSRCEISYKRNQGQPFPFRIVIRIDLGRCYIFRHETFERIYHDRRLYKRDREIFFETSKKCL